MISFTSYFDGMFSNLDGTSGICGMSMAGLDLFFFTFGLLYYVGSNSIFFSSAFLSKSVRKTEVVISFNGYSLSR